MYAIVAGGGKVGASIARSLLRMGHEVTLVEQRRERFEELEAELGPAALAGDATEIYVLELAGIAGPPELVLAVTGDDEDNIVIAQIAQGGYRVPKVVARVNDPRNQPHFDLLGVNQTVCATSGLLGLVEHEVPEHGLVRLLELRGEGLEVVELQVPPNAPAAGKRVAGISLPADARLVSVTRNGVAELVDSGTVIRPGDQVVAVLKPGNEESLRRALSGVD
jgi:trk system potassium uptake protein TrkA